MTAALGGTAYAAPLIVFGAGEATWVVAAACAAIIGDALLKSRDMSRR